jgi:hypothetical protein
MDLSAHDGPSSGLERVIEYVIAAGLLGPEDVRSVCRPLCWSWDSQVRVVVLASPCHWLFVSSAETELLRSGAVGGRLLGNLGRGGCLGGGERVARLIARGPCVRSFFARRMCSSADAAEVLLALEAGSRLESLDLGGGSAHALLGVPATRDRAAAALSALSGLRELAVGAGWTSWMSHDSCYDASVARTVPAWLGGLASLERLDARGFGWVRTSDALAAALRDGALTRLRALRLTCYVHAGGGGDALAAALAGPHLAPTLRELELVLVLPSPVPAAEHAGLSAPAGVGLALGALSRLTSLALCSPHVGVLLPACARLSRLTALRELELRDAPLGPAHAAAALAPALARLGQLRALRVQLHLQLQEAAGGGGGGDSMRELCAAAPGLEELSVEYELLWHERVDEGDLAASELDMTEALRPVGRLASLRSLALRFVDSARLCVLDPRALGAPGLLCLDLRQCGLPAGGLGGLTRLETLSLHGVVPLRGRGLARATCLDALREMPGLRGLHVVDSPHLLAPLQWHRSRMPLSLQMPSSGGGGGALADPAVRALARALPPSLTELALAGNGLRARDAAALAPRIAELRALRSLDLGANALGPAGVRLVAEAVTGLRSLRALHLGRNDAGPEGARALANALGQLTALTALRV